MRVRRDLEQRLRAQEQAHHHRRAHRRQHHRSQNPRAPRADHLFDHKKHRRNRRVEGRRQPRRRSYRRDQAHLLARKMQPPPQRRRDSRAHLQRRIFRPQRLAAADGQRAGQEFPDHRVEGNISVVDVYRGLGLRDAAALHPRKNPLHHERQQQPRQRRHQHDAHRARPGRQRPDARSQQPPVRVVDGDAEANHGQAREQPDDHREEQKEVVLAHGKNGARPLQCIGQARSHPLREIYLAALAGNFRTPLRRLFGRALPLRERVTAKAWLPALCRWVWRAGSWMGLRSGPDARDGGIGRVVGRAAVLRG